MIHDRLMLAKYWILFCKWCCQQIVYSVSDAVSRLSILLVMMSADWVL